MSSSSTEHARGSSPVEAPEVILRRHAQSLPWTYAQLDALQRQIADRVRSGRGRGALLLSELAPVITCGRRTPERDLLISRDQLGRLGIEFYQTDRGGLATYHGPGQWVLFAIDRLERLSGDPRGVRKVVSALLEIGCRVARSYDPSSQIRDQIETGVWSSRGKVASVGIHVEDHVVLHGLAINGFKTPLSFMGIRPCGLEPQVDFLLQNAIRHDSWANKQADPLELERAFLELGDRIQRSALEVLWKPS